MISSKDNIETNIVKKGSLLNFFVLLVILSIPLWILGAIYNIQIFPGFNLYQLPLGMPMVAAFILIYREGGKTAVIALLKRTYDFKNIKSKIWYLPMLLMIPSIGFIEYLILRFSGASIPLPQFSLATLGYVLIFFLTYGEELGWTGYLIDPMQERWSAFKSSIFIGVIWGGVHVPILFINGYSFEWIFWHALPYTIAIRVLMVWIYNNTGKSLFAMALTHWTFGLFWVLWPVENLHRVVFFYDPRIMAFVAMFYVAVITFLWGPKTLAEYRFARIKNK